MPGPAAEQCVGPAHCCARGALNDTLIALDALPKAQAVFLSFMTVFGEYWLLKYSVPDEDVTSHETVLLSFQRDGL